jgi:hypothetical protein
MVNATASFDAESGSSSPAVSRGSGTAVTRSILSREMTSGPDAGPVRRQTDSKAVQRPTSWRAGAWARRWPRGGHHTSAALVVRRTRRLRTSARYCRTQTPGDHTRPVCWCHCGSLMAHRCTKCRSCRGGAGSGAPRGLLLPGERRASDDRGLRFTRARQTPPFTHTEEIRYQ